MTYFVVLSVVFSFLVVGLVLQRGCVYLLLDVCKCINITSHSVAAKSLTSRSPKFTTKLRQQ